MIGKTPNFVQFSEQLRKNASKFKIVNKILKV